MEQRKLENTTLFNEDVGLTNKTIEREKKYENNERERGRNNILNVRCLFLKYKKTRMKSMFNSMLL